MWGDMKVPLGVIKDGKKEGKWISWYKNGKKESEGTFKNGKEDGLWTYWVIMGYKKEEITYKDGVKDGLFTDWYENGKKYISRMGNLLDSIKIGMIMDRRKMKDITRMEKRWKMD